MKKTLISLLVLMLTGISCVFASEVTKFSRGFIKHFKDCDVYEETVTSTFEDEEFKSQRKILGWKNGVCRYTETITSKSGGYRLNCNFPEIQVDELYDAMRNRSKTPERFNLEIFTPEVDPKTGETVYVTKGTTLIKGNKAYIAWAKYQNNPYFCKAEKIR
jgi:hypothetical protein